MIDDDDEVDDDDDDDDPSTAFDFGSGDGTFNSFFSNIVNGMTWNTRNSHSVQITSTDYSSISGSETVSHD